jgi:mycofactocin system creatininase family protein
VTNPSRRLRNMTSLDVASIDHPILAVPVGSCEQHGGHLPLGTDSIIAEYLCDRLAAAHGRVVIAPTITISSSGEHEGFAGTLSIGSMATTSTLIELVRSAHWASSIVFVNGHGGNMAAVAESVALLRAESRHVTDWWPRIDGDAHAGHVETSIMLYVANELVNSDRLEAGDIRPLREIAGALRKDGVRGVSPNGVLGDPRTASSAAGAEIVEGLLGQLLDHVSVHHP